MLNVAGGVFKYIGKGEIFVFMVCIFVLIVSTLFFKSVIEYAPGF